MSASESGSYLCSFFWMERKNKRHKTSLYKICTVYSFKQRIFFP